MTERGLTLTIEREQGLVGPAGHTANGEGEQRRKRGEVSEMGGILVARATGRTLEGVKEGESTYSSEYDGELSRRRLLD
jgi:hypothetical protein